MLLSLAACGGNVAGSSPVGKDAAAAADAALDAGSGRLCPIARRRTELMYDITAGAGVRVQCDSPAMTEATDAPPPSDGAADGGAVLGDGGTPITDAGTYGCGLEQCKLGLQLCYIPANVGPDAGSCFDLNGCTTCACSQSQFQCISKCMQVGQELFVSCQ